MKNKLLLLSTVAALLSVNAAHAENATAPAAAAPSSPSLMLSLGSTLMQNPHPYSYDAGSFGEIYVTGVVSGLAFTQSHAVPHNPDSTADWGNAQVFVQKADGPVQFFVQGGIYSVRSLGTAYLRAEDYTEKTFNYLPQGFVKLVPTDNFSVQIGKLPTLFGAESTFTVQNLNIERGLLWNQENAVNRGIQANYSTGPLTFNLSWNDGFYSNKYNWLSGMATWTINGENTLMASAGGNLGHTSHADFATPLAQNNGQIYDVIYSWNKGPWTLSPYAQYTYVPQEANLGLADSASTFGVALLGKYSFTSNWSLAGRAEYIDSNGSATSPNLLYGPNSKAWSATLTPTYQQGIWFGRAEASYVRADNITAGSAFGSSGNDRSQGRLMLETGALF